MPSSKSLWDRFIEKVDFNGSLILDTPCWEWKACKCKGYGRLGNGFGRAPLFAHRLSWEFYRGKIPDGLFVCHRCDNPSCVNPDHLFLGTHKDNMTDMQQKGRRNKVPDKWRTVKGFNSKIKLTDDQVRAIRCDTRLLEEIATEYNIDQSMVSLIRRRKRRIQVTD